MATTGRSSGMTPGGAGDYEYGGPSAALLAPAGDRPPRVLRSGGCELVSLPGAEHSEGAGLLSDHPCPSSPATEQRREREAARVLRTEGLVGYCRLCLASASRVWPAYLGSTMEFYELASYLQAGQALRANFFHGSSLWGSVGVWVGHGCTFLVRPLGGLLFGQMADKYGRRGSMMVTVIGMSMATTLIGCLPHGQGGAAMLLILKIAQGLFVSGEGPAAVVYAIERSHKATAGVTGTSLFVSSVYVGIFLASVVTLVVASCLSDQQYLDWGWRLPFLLALPLGAVMLKLRENLPETEAFRELLAARREAAAESTAAHRGSKEEKEGSGSQPVDGHFTTAVVLGMLSICCNPAAAYGGLLYFPTFLTATTGLYSVRQATGLAITGTVAGIVVTPVCGLLGDAYGHSSMVLWGSLLVMLLSWPLWVLTVADLRLAYVAVVLWACMLAFQGGVYATFLAEIFPIHARASGIGLAYNLAFSLFGGLCPLLETICWSALVTGCSSCSGWVVHSSPALLLIAVGLLGLVACLRLDNLKARGIVPMYPITSHSDWAG